MQKNKTIGPVHEEGPSEDRFAKLASEYREGSVHDHRDSMIIIDSKQIAEV
jgi:hypothetical protein